jgi:hypothetical protein
VADLPADDHVVTFPRTALWRTRLPRARVTLLIVEPRAIHGPHMRWCRWFGWRFHRILTRDEPTLLACRNARFFLGTDTWLSDLHPDTTKTRGVSLIASAKRDLEGHRLRHAVVDALGPDTHVDVMGAGYRPFGDKAEGLAPYTHSVVIENSRERGYLTEKIIDAVICETVPIYWGAPDVTEHLDAEGLILCDGLDDILAAIARATPEDHAARAEALRRNAEAARELADLHGMAARAVRDDPFVAEG